MRFARSTVLLMLLVAVSAACTRTTAGWRTDGSGRYLDADPPLQWSADQNVVWATPMPTGSNGTATVCEDRIFVTAEETQLLCVNKADGEILWQVSNDWKDFLPAAELAKVDLAVKLTESLGTLHMRRDHIDGELKKLKRAEPVDEAKVAELVAEREQVEAQIASVTAEREPVAEYVKAATHPDTGYGSATPVTDGRFVYALFGTGVAACFDFDGQRRWIRRVDTPHVGLGHSSSPLLVDDKLIIHIKDVIAVDPKTGQESWRTPSQVHFGTAVVAKIAGRSVLITPQGDFIRVCDGMKLAGTDAKLDRASPIVNDGLAIFACTLDKKVTAIRLPDRAEPFTAEVAWSLDGFYQYNYCSPVSDGKVLYVLEENVKLHAIDVANGDVIYTERVEGLGGTTYPSLALAGQYVYLSSENGATVVVEAGRQYKKVAESKLEEKLRGSMVFEESRMYLRAHSHLYCFGQ